MPLINYGTREITYKIVFYGPGLGGKTTNLQYIHSQLMPTCRGDLTSLATETERTLFFDYMPLEFGKVNGFEVKVGLYTVPGQQEYNRSRRQILHDVDALVFVADSSASRMEQNLESILNMVENLESNRLKLDNVPWVFQYNKRDLQDALPVDEMEAMLNASYKVPSYESVAIDGRGVFNTLKSIVKLVIAKT